MGNDELDEQRRNVESIIDKKKDLSADERYRLVTGRDPLENKPVHDYTTQQLLLKLSDDKLDPTARRVLQAELERRASHQDPGDNKGRRGGVRLS